MSIRTHDQLPVEIEEAASYSSGQVRMKTGGTVACSPLLVVAVPDPCIQELLQMALHLYGYQVLCTPIDRLHPLAWVAQACRVQPAAVIVDIDLFRFCSLQQSILAVQLMWEMMPWRSAPGWIWLSRRPACNQIPGVINMPFHLAQLEASIQHACRSNQHTQQ